MDGLADDFKNTQQLAGKIVTIKVSTSSFGEGKPAFPWQPQYVDDMKMGVTLYAWRILTTVTSLLSTHVRVCMANLDDITLVHRILQAPYILRSAGLLDAS
ncbi:hypothetical protein ACUNV4_00020 [Granulosicoccus sp. 3-233]